MSNMDFFQIGALKVFAELGQLIEEDEKNQFKFMDLPSDMIQNNILSYFYFYSIFFNLLIWIL